MNLHDWIDELCDVLDLEAEVDEGLLNDLAELTRDNVDPAAGAVTTYLLGLAAGRRGAGPAGVERLAARAQELAEGWARPATRDDDGDAADDLPLDLSDIPDDEDDDGDDDESDADDSDVAGLVARR